MSVLWIGGLVAVTVVTLGVCAACNVAGTCDEQEEQELAKRGLYYDKDGKPHFKNEE